MCQKLNPFTPIGLLDPDFVQLINHILLEQDIGSSLEVVINFRDPSYSYENGGYHPVEIAVSANGGLNYLTDFAYVGSPPMVELAKELDFDFTLNHFIQFDSLYELDQGRSLFNLYIKNFTAYYHSGVYQVSVTQL